jgi:hypothetical protein
VTTAPFHTLLLVAALVLFILAAIFAWPVWWGVLASAAGGAFVAAHLP